MATRGRRRRRRRAPRARRSRRWSRDARPSARAESSCARPPGCASDRGELAALAVRECAKPWGEADADVCEAIDFLEFYARGAIALDQGKELFQVPGERNEMRYAAARRRRASIAPWNFPIAIPMGMTAAGLATGNTVVLKPAEQSPGCGLHGRRRAARGRRARRARSASLPGDGEAGAALVAPPRRPRRSPSPAAARSASRSCARPPRSRPARGTSSASSPRWAARTA